jgi:hypothetical protein
MAKLQHIITDLHQVYLTEMEAKIKPQLGKTPASSAAPAGGEKKSDGGGDDNIKKQARQLVYDTRYKARREGLPLERAFAQALQNSKASAPVKDAAKSMLFSGGVKEEINIEEEDKQKVLVTPAKGYGKPYRRYATRSKIHQLRTNPQIQSVTGTSYGTPYEGERKQGKQTSAALQHKPSNKKSKPDFLDLDGDGNKKESMKKAVKDKEKKVEEAVKPNDGNLANNYPPYDKVTRGDIIAGALGKDQMGGKKKKKKITEEYSDWRSDLYEVISNSKNDDVKKIAEKNVNNKVVINPELSEEVISKSVEIATEFFFEQGLNEDGVNILIEELGLEDFAQFVFDLVEEYTLTEARRSGRIEPVTKGGKSVANLKGGAKTAAIKRLRAQKAASRSAEGSSSNSSGMKAALQRQSAVANAKKQQPAKKPLKDRIAKGVLGAINAYQKGMERHRAATATASKAVKVAAKGASEFGKGVASGVKTTAKVAKAAHKVLNNSYEMDEAVYGGEKKEPEDKRMIVTAADKKANTKAWQKFSAGHPSYKAAAHLQNSSFEPEGDSVDEGLAQARKNVGASKCWPGKVAKGTKMKNGREVPNCVPEAAREPYAIGMAAAMKSTGDTPPLEKSTIKKAHKIAKKIEAQEAVDPKSVLSPKQKDTERQQTLNAKAKLEKILSTRKSDYREETELDELNRYEKETGKDYKTGKKITKGGTMGGDDTNSKVMRHMHKVMGAGRMGAGGAIQPRGQTRLQRQSNEREQDPNDPKKMVRKRPASAGPTPEQKVAKRRAAAQRAQDMYKPRAGESD